MAQQDSAGPALVVTVHGIRTFGGWQNRLAALMRQARPDARISSYGYGYFSAIAFAVPFLRWIEVRRFRSRLLQVFRANPGARVSIVAHSFGTHIVAWALRGMDPRDLPSIRCILLAGSVLKSDFDWSPLLDSGKVDAVVNDCGVDDNVLLLSQFAILFTGMAGRVGFYGFTHERLVNRFFAGAHSHYFQPLDPDPDAFMRSHWVGLLLGTTRVEAMDQRPPLGPLRGAAYALMPFADPIKLAAYLGIGGLLVYHSAILPRQELVLADAQRGFVEARTLLASELSVGEAVGAFVELATDSRLRSTELGQNATVLARYGIQRIVDAHEILKGVPKGAVFRYNGASYLHGDRTVRLSIDPLAAFVVPDQGMTVLLREAVASSTSNRGTEIHLIDAATGQSRAVFSEEHDNSRLTEPFALRRLPSRPHQLLLGFRMEDVDGDNARTKWWALDLRASTGQSLQLRSPLVLKDCSGIVQDSEDEDDDDKASRRYSVRSYSSLFEASTDVARTVDHATMRELTHLGDERDACTVPIPSVSVETLVLPGVVPEATLFSAPTGEQPAQAAAMKDPGPLCGTDEPATVRPVAQGLKLSDSNPPSAVGLEAVQFQAHLDEPICRRLLKGPSGATYLANLVALGQWTGGWTVCELKMPGLADKCDTVAFPSEDHGGMLWHESGAAWAAVRMGRTPGFGMAFSLLRLADRKRLDPDVSPAGYATSLVIDEEGSSVLVAATVPGSPHSVELLVYRIGANQLWLLGRRQFDRQQQAGAPRDLPDAQLFRAGAFTVLSLPGESLMGIAIGEGGRSMLVRWTHRSVELGTSDVASVWPSPDGKLAAITAGSSVRLLLLADGTIFTPTVDLAAPPRGCGQQIRSVAFDASGAITVDLGTCVRQRRAPAPSVNRVDFKRASELPPEIASR
ncbi:hypothetical protein [Rhizobacter sp. P5_C2]